METLSGTQQQVVTRLLRHYVSFELRHLTNCIDKSLVVLCSMVDHLEKKESDGIARVASFWNFETHLIVA